MKSSLALGLVAFSILGVGATAQAATETPEPGQPLDDVLVVAHRGASDYQPEHTFAAYDLAIEMDADMIECDVQITADEQLVCLHDTTLNRTARDAETGERITGRIEDYTLAELREMDFGSWKGEEFGPQSIVPFGEQLICYRTINPNIRFHIETKDPDGYEASMEDLVAQMLDRVGYIPDEKPSIADTRVIIQSFAAGSLERMREIAPTLPTAYLSIPTSWDIPDTWDALSPSYRYILQNPTFIDEMHQQGKFVQAYTVNDEASMNQLLDLGIDGMFTNKPDLLRGLVDARGTGVPAAERGNPTDFERGCPGVAGTVNSIEDVPQVPEVTFEQPKSNIKAGSTVPVRYTAEATLPGAVSGTHVVVEQPDGTRVEPRIVANGKQVQVRTDRAQPGDYDIIVLDDTGWEIERLTISAR